MSINFTYTAVRNPKWANPEQTQIELQVNFDHEPDEWVEFVTQASGDYPHTHELHARAIAGDFGTIAAYEGLPPLTGDEAVAHIREVRNMKLAETDHWALSDTATMSTEQTNYRQALRDLPDNLPADARVEWDRNGGGYVSYPNVTWPTEP